MQRKSVGPKTVRSLFPGTGNIYAFSEEWKCWVKVTQPQEGNWPFLHVWAQFYFILGDLGWVIEGWSFKSSSLSYDFLVCLPTFFCAALVGISDFLLLAPIVEKQCFLFFLHYHLFLCLLRLHPDGGQQLHEKRPLGPVNWGQRLKTTLLVFICCDEAESH